MATVYTFPYKEGLALATKEINEAGGVLGRPLEFVHRDDKLKPDEAVKAARELVLQDKVDFLAGCISSGVGLAISAYAKDAKVLYFATHCQTSRLTWDDGHPYVAHTTNNVNQYVRVAAKKAATLPIKKWANISPDYEYGHNMWDEFSTYLKKLKPDVQFVHQSWPKLGETDHSAYITALLQSGAEGLFSSVWGSQSIAFVKQARPFGLFDKMRYVAPSVGNPDELDPLGKEAPVGRHRHARSPGTTRAPQAPSRSSSRGPRSGSSGRRPEGSRTRSPSSGPRGATPAPTSSPRPSSGRRAPTPTRSSPC